MTFSGTRFTGFYLSVQATAVCGWWGWLILFPSHRALFLPSGASETELVAFMLPDLAITVASSLAGAVLFFSTSVWVVPVAWLSAGSVLYAATYCLSWAALRGSGWLSVALMLPAALLATLAALDTSAGYVSMFRRASPASPQRHLWATAFQTLLFWSFFLFVFPALLLALEQQLLGAPDQVLIWRVVACVLFLVCSSLGLASGYTIAARGEGTPLPLDAPNRLVTAGPYGYIRNPMVVSGLGQGMAVALWLGSWAVLAYVVFGGLIWQFLVRPAEEADLEATFGEDYQDYRRRVRCWIPTRGSSAETA